MIRLRSISARGPLALLAAGLAALALGAAFAPAAPGPPARVPSRPVCPGPAAAGSADCHARVVTDRGGMPHATAAPTGYGPAQFRGAYELPAEAPVPRTIAIVDAYDSPTIEEDLAVYSETYGLPPCTTANGCFRKVNQEGAEGPYPKADSGWALEIALDVETAHAICPNCEILLVEASSNGFGDLGTAVNTAASMGADAISNSYGSTGEFSGETAADSAYYDHPGIAITASAGDSGFGAEFPAASPHVVAVGGTQLTLGPANSYGGETAWSGSGSGCSALLPARSWQTSDPSWALTGCGTYRGVADVAAVADPATGASVYDTTKYKGQEGWFKLGGTSLSAPLIAAVYALAGGGEGAYPAAGPYAHQADSPASLHDVTSGSNGSCGGTVMCGAAVGYDGPTGVGTPKGLLAFGGATPEPPVESHVLTVHKVGGGQGWLYSEESSGGTPRYAINCGTSCTDKSAEIAGEVTLRASGHEFVEWTSCPGVESGRECTAPMAAAEEATAKFADRNLLTAEKEGPGQGWVHSEAPAYAINCGLTCTTKSAYFRVSETPTLTASGIEFERWTVCPGTKSGRECRDIPMGEARTAKARFATRHALTVHKTGTTTEGWVHSESPAYTINCGNSCATKTGFFEPGTVTLTASGARFVEWEPSAPCLPGTGGTSRECAVELTADETAEARFE